jgi:hypothetical protein
MEKLEAATDALSHSHPGADVKAILEAGLDALLERAAKRQGLVKRPRAAAPPTDADTSENARYVPATVRREVWLVRYQDIADGKRVRTSLTGSAG